VFDIILGLPVHILTIHAVVVLVPLAALSAIAYVVRPGWRRLLRWPTAAGAVISGVSAFVAAQSGEALLRRVSQARASTTDFEMLTTHTEWGSRARLVCIVFMVLTLLALWFARPPQEEAPRGHALDMLLGTLVVLSALAALAAIAIAGHAGSAVVWKGLA
jgi:ABC-type transport system involved in cytochrome bd biosynthesis fused ATPase/permease subunit